MDITYVRLAQRGFAYLVAIIDWYSRRVLSWKLSNTLESGFCVEALDDALRRHGRPEIFNSDQGSQFTSEDFISRLKAEETVKISMDSRGMAYDNIFTERLWRAVKYEDIYLHEYQDIPQCRAGLERYFSFYNTERRHQSLEYKTPWETFRAGTDWRVNDGQMGMMHVPGAPVSSVQVYHPLFYSLGYSHRSLPDRYALPAYPPPMRPGADSPAFPEYPGAGTRGFLFQPSTRVTPRAGAWIETTSGAAACSSVLMSPLTQGRGLKQLLAQGTYFCCMSPFAQGVET